MTPRSASLSLCQQCLRTTPRRQPPRISRITLVRAASSSTPSQHKPIVLEQPDKFRPPSHPARLNRRPPRAYNQGTTAGEKESQKSRAYPHMFPDRGSFMHWFLTDRWIHLWITMGTLTILAVVTLTQSFVKTSPYAHLLPPVSSLAFHPVTYVREALSVVRLHIEYTTQRTNDSRQQKILDAQKRRLYRRAHGMEDLDAEEEQGIDVRGLVEWDDGLTKKERAAGGRDVVMTGRDVVALGGQVGDDIGDFARRRREELSQTEPEAEVEADAAALVQPEQKRKRKMWLGIW